MQCRGWFSELLSLAYDRIDATVKLRSEVRREFVLGDTLIGQARLNQRSVALAGVHVNVPINVLAVTMNDVSTSECVVLVERFIRPKAVSIDSQGLLVAIS